LSGLATVDIEDFAKKVKSSLVTHYTNVAYVALVAQMPVLATPVISSIVKAIIELVVEKLAGIGGLAAFMINTGIFTQDQAKDYISSIQKIDQLPEGVSNEEWEKAEDGANIAFSRAINLKS